MPIGCTEVLPITDEEKKKCIANLRALMKDDEFLSQLETDDLYLRRFIECAEYDGQAAFKRMKMFYDVLQEFPDWFSVGCPADKKNIIDQDIRLVTEEYDKEGRPIYIVNLAKMASMDLVKDIIPVDDFFVETLLSQSACASKGICVIVDVANFPWKLMKWLTPRNITIIIKRIQTMPIKEYRIHLVNNSFLVKAAIRIVWPLLPQYLKDSVFFHFSDWNALYKHIERDVLPVEYGGKKDKKYSDYHIKVYDKNLEIANSFKINRKLYLTNINNKISKK